VRTNMKSTDKLPIIRRKLPNDKEWAILQRDVSYIKESIQAIREAIEPLKMKVYCITGAISVIIPIIVVMISLAARS
jgi:hypothetical protein